MEQLLYFEVDGFQLDNLPAVVEAGVTVVPSAMPGDAEELERLIRRYNYCNEWPRST
jgi:hypothetical protein